jgi:CRP-like cAMP-binding protein/predicted MFS family arabinose efflux permease
MGQLTAAFGLFSLSYSAVTLALGIYGFEVAGALGAGLAGARVIPAAVAGIVGGRVAARVRPGFVLLGVATAEVLVLSAIGAALLVGAPFGIVLALAVADAVVVMAFQPAQARLLPALVRTPSELTAAAARLSNVKGAAQVGGALAGGVVIAALGAAATFLSAAVAVAAAGGVLVPVVRRVRGRRAEAGADAASSPGLRRLGMDSGVARVMAVSGVRSFVRGLWLTLTTVVALDLMGLDESGVGVLMAAAGVGVVMAFPASALLVGRHSLLAPLAVALTLFGAPLLLIAAVPEPGLAMGLLALWGLGAALADATVSSLLFRIVAGREIARVVGGVESLKLALGGAGALCAPVLVGLLGVRGAIACTGALPFVLLALEWRALRQVDDLAGRRVKRVELLGRVPLFRALRVDALEQAAAALIPVELPAGAEVVRQEDNDARRWFLVEDGIADVLVDGWRVATLGPGSSFGEKALLRSVPRAATVRARTPLRLQALDRAPFLAAATGDPSGAVPADSRGLTQAPAEPAEVLRVVPLLTGLEQQTLEELVALGHERAVPAGEDVVREGQLADRLYVLLEGKAAVYSGQRLVRTLAPSDHFGEIALLHRIPRTATVRGQTDLRLFSVDREALLAAGPDGLTTAQLV